MQKVFVEKKEKILRIEEEEKEDWSNESENEIKEPCKKKIKN
jgi:hypothetical protein